MSLIGFISNRILLEQTTLNLNKPFEIRNPSETDPRPRVGRFSLLQLPEMSHRITKRWQSWWHFNFWQTAEEIFYLTELEKINKQEGYTRGRGKGEWAERNALAKTEMTRERSECYFYSEWIFPENKSKICEG